MVRLAELEKAVEQLPSLKQQVDALSRQVTEQAERIEGLQARIDNAPAHHVEPRQLPQRLQEINSARQRRCNRLREKIASILTQCQAPDALTGKEVAQALANVGFDPLPKERTVRLRLAEVRAEMATHGNTLNCQKSV